MDIEAMRTFLVLADTGSFTKTSQTMFVAQSTVSNRINELEKELKAVLFERTNKKVELTPAGARFRDYAQKVMDLTDSELPNISSYQEERTLRIGCANTIYECHLEKALLKDVKRNPNRPISVSIDLSKELNRKLQDDLLDVVYSFIPLNKARYSCEVYKTDEMVLVTDIGNKKYTTISREELIREKYIMCDFALREVGVFIRSIFPKYHKFPIETDDCLKVIPFLEGNDYYTFLPKVMAQPLIREKKIRKVNLSDLDTPVITSYVITKK